MRNILGKLLTGLFMAAMIGLGVAAGLTIFAVMNGDAPWQKADSEAVQDGSAGDTPETEDGGAAEPEPETEVREAGDLGDYYVHIKSAAAAEDYEGRPAVVATYSWTNNSENTISPFAALHVKAYQNDMQLDSAVVIDKGKFDSSNYMQDVRPGETIQVQSAFHLVSRTADIRIEISELTGSTDQKVVMDFAVAKLG